MAEFDIRLTMGLRGFYETTVTVEAANADDAIAIVNKHHKEGTLDELGVEWEHGDHYEEIYEDFTTENTNE